MKKKKNPYDTLDVDRDATDDEIKRAHRIKARQTHPDVIGGDREEFEEVQFAKTLLLNHKRRQRYDETGDAAEENPNTLLNSAIGIMVSFFDMKCGEYFNSNFNPQVDPRRRNMIKEFQAKVNGDIANMENAISNMTTAIDVFKDMVKRTTTKEKNNFLVQHYQFKIAGITQEMERAKRTCEEMRFAIELSKKYGFRFEEIDPDVFQQGYVSFVVSRA